MHASPTHSGEMSQGSGMSDPHRNPVPPKALDPVARRSKRAFTALTTSAIGLELGACVVIGTFFGRWLDGKWGTAPWLMIVGLALGFTAGIMAIVRGAKRADRAIEAQEREDA